MSQPQRNFLLLAVIALSAGLANAQVGTILGGANTLLACYATAVAPELRPEGYSEMTGDIVIICAGGPVLQMSAAVPTATLIVYMSPAVPITSRSFGPSPNPYSTFLSDPLLIIDEAGSSINTGATGGYGPQAPQSLCTSAQQQTYANPSPCAAQVGLDASGNYQVAVLPGTSTPAQNVYQGEVGDFGANSVVFYNVPVLPPAYFGVSRIFRITNLRVPVPGGNLTGTLQAVISTIPNQHLPVATAIDIGVVGPPMTATVNASPAGGGNQFSACKPVTSPTLAPQITFTEGFATSFKTRVVPLENAKWAAQAQNLASPANQNIPGGLYGNFASNSESGLILPALNYTDATSNTTYTAGLADFGTRLKAVFSNVPAGVTVYVSTSSAGTVALPGGPGTTSYAVMVAAGQSAEATGDGASFAPLTSSIIASDGLAVYPLDADNSGATAAIWEVVNSDPSAIDTLTFNVYIAYSSTSGTINPANAALSYAPEPGGGSFATVNATQGLDSPEPRFAILQTQRGPFATIDACAFT